MKTKPWYSVIVFDHSGNRSIMHHKNRFEWRKDTAIKYALGFKKQHGKDCSVIDSSTPINEAIPVFTTKES